MKAMLTSEMLYKENFSIFICGLFLLSATCSLLWPTKRLSANHSITSM